MSWGSLKRAVNSTIGDEDFKPLDKILIEGLEDIKNGLKNGSIIPNKSEQTTVYPFQRITSIMPNSLNDEIYCITGRWYFHHRAADAQNAWQDMPNGCTNGWLETLQSPTTTTICDQMFYRAGSTSNFYEVYTRTRFSQGEWSEWRRLVTREELVNGDIVVAKATEAVRATEADSAIVAQYAKEDDEETIDDRLKSIESNYLHQVVMARNGGVISFTCVLNDPFPLISINSIIEAFSSQNLVTRIPASGTSDINGLAVAALRVDDDNNVIKLLKYDGYEENLEEEDGNSFSITDKVTKI